MAPRFWTPTFRQYLLLQVPDLVLGAIGLAALYLWVGLPLWASVVLFLLWVIKDIAPYVWLREALERPPSVGPESLVGARGAAVETLDPAGYVRVQGELWRATSLKPHAIPDLLTYSPAEMSGWRAAAEGLDSRGPGNASPIWGGG